MKGKCMQALKMNNEYFCREKELMKKMPCPLRKQQLGNKLIIQAPEC